VVDDRLFAAVAVERFGPVDQCHAGALVRKREHSVPHIIGGRGTRLGGERPGRPRRVSVLDGGPGDLEFRRGVVLGTLMGIQVVDAGDERASTFARLV
jgi:hypothetical protein